LESLVQVMDWKDVEKVQKIKVVTAKDDLDVFLLNSVTGQD